MKERSEFLSDPSDIIGFHKAFVVGKQFGWSLRGCHLAVRDQQIVEIDGQGGEIGQVRMALRVGEGQGRSQLGSHRKVGHENEGAWLGFARPDEGEPDGGDGKVEARLISKVEDHSIQDADVGLGGGVRYCTRNVEGKQGLIHGMDLVFWRQKLQGERAGGVPLKVEELRKLGKGVRETGRVLGGPVRGIGSGNGGLWGREIHELADGLLADAGEHAEEDGDLIDEVEVVRGEECTGLEQGGEVVEDGVDGVGADEDGEGAEEEAAVEPAVDVERGVLDHLGEGLDGELRGEGGEGQVLGGQGDEEGQVVLELVDSEGLEEGDEEVLDELADGLGGGGEYLGDEADDGHEPLGGEPEQLQQELAGGLALVGGQDGVGVGEEVEEEEGVGVALVEELKVAHQAVQDAEVARQAAAGLWGADDGELGGDGDGKVEGGGHHVGDGDVAGDAEVAGGSDPVQGLQLHVEGVEEGVADGEVGEARGEHAEGGLEGGDGRGVGEAGGGLEGGDEGGEEGEELVEQRHVVGGPQGVAEAQVEDGEHLGGVAGVARQVVVQQREELKSAPLGHQRDLVSDQLQAGSEVCLKIQRENRRRNRYFLIILVLIRILVMIMII